MGFQTPEKLSFHKIENLVIWLFLKEEFIITKAGASFIRQLLHAFLKAKGKENSILVLSLHQFLRKADLLSSRT